MEPVDDLNAGTPLGLLGAGVTPTEAFYRRSNFEVPQVDPSRWQLTASGLFAEPRTFSLDEVRSMESVTQTVTMECAGNGRLLMRPVPEGTPWGLGAVGVAQFTGVALERVLRLLQPTAEVVDVVFTGLDAGPVYPTAHVNYAFNLGRDAALSSGPMLVWDMNGAPLPAEHGFPLRLVVPGLYGMNSVKWLSGITAVDEEFTGYFRQKYRYYGDPEAAEAEPVGAMRVRSLISAPTDGANVAGEVEVRGIAWSGSGGIASVVVGADGDWFEAVLGGPLGSNAPTPWSAAVSLTAGTHVVVARATDTSGRVQPLEPVWNRNGYANNVVHRVTVSVE